MKNPDKIYLGTNTKMYKTPSEAEAHIRRLGELTRDIAGDMNLFVIPSYTSLQTAAAAAKHSSILIGAQNMGWEETGQYTGEISPLMLREAGAGLVMIGHSERRHVFRETDFEEEKKVKCAAEHGFITLLCVGETKAEKEYGIAGEVLSKQLKIGLHSLPPELAKRCLWIAYEPVWAIGVSGVPADEAYANKMHGAIKDVLRGLYGDETGGRIPVLYGGSVNRENAGKLIVQSDIDGLFIGRSAWDADNFNLIIRDVLPLFRSKKERVS